MSIWRQLGIVREVPLSALTLTTAQIPPTVEVATSRPIVRAIYNNHHSGEVTIDITDKLIAGLVVVTLILVFIVILSIQRWYYRRNIPAPILNDTEVQLFVANDQEEPSRPRTRSQTAVQCA